MAYLPMTDFDDSYNQIDVGVNILDYNLLPESGGSYSDWTTINNIKYVIQLYNSTSSEIKINIYTDRGFTGQPLSVKNLLDYLGIDGTTNLINTLNTGHRYGVENLSSVTLPFIQFSFQSVSPYSATGRFFITSTSSSYMSQSQNFVGDLTGLYLFRTNINNANYYGFIIAGYNSTDYYSNQILISIAKRSLFEFDNILEYESGDVGYEPTSDKTYDRTIGGVAYDSNGKKRKSPDYSTDTISNPDEPDETNASAIGSGLIHAYLMTNAGLNTFGQVLYGTTLSGLLTGTVLNPLDYLISLNIFPYIPYIGGSEGLKIGRWTCSTDKELAVNCTGQPLTKQFRKISLGTVSILENWGSFLDYSLTKAELYLPFIGTVDIDISEIMGGTLSLDYTIDFFTGCCIANVNCSKSISIPASASTSRNIAQYSQHSYQGNCAINVPLSAIQYGNMIGSLISGGMNAIKGDASAVASDLVSAGMAFLTPPVSSKGSISANAGYGSILYPYLRITRPISLIPSSYQEVNGFPSYIDGILGSCSGLCVCDDINLSGVSYATENELNRIKQLCKEGVYV